MYRLLPHPPNAVLQQDCLTQADLAAEQARRALVRALARQAAREAYAATVSSQTKGTPPHE